MRIPRWVGLAAAAGILLGWGASGAQKRAQKSQSKVHQERLNLVDEYKKCLNKAGENKVKIEACDSYLEAAEALN